MTGNGIRLDKVNLHYSLAAFKERSLKALITGAFAASISWITARPDTAFRKWAPE